MLTDITIKNVAVIRNLSLSFGKGMSVLTGETGAGKSIIIDSINMILGDRTNKALVRYGEDKAVVQAVFEVGSRISAILEEMGIDCEDGQVILTREVSGLGKSVCRINGIIVTLSQMRELAPELVNIHGQHDNQALLTPSKHIRFLDDFAKNEAERAIYQEQYQKLKLIEKRLAELQMDETEKMRRLDLLDYQINEIFSARLERGEEEELKEQREVISNAEKIAQYGGAAYDNLYGGGEVQSAYDGISMSVRALEEIKAYAPALEEIHQSLSGILYTLEDAAHEIKDYTDHVEFDEAVLDDVEERLDLIGKLKRKYGKNIEEILAFGDRAQKERDEISMGEEQLEKLRREEAELQKALRQAAQKLSATRGQAGKQLEMQIKKALRELDMDKAEFKVALTDAGSFGQNGGDKAEFLFSANPGEPPRALDKIASGGELSRVMLAIKSILADSDQVGTLIFDEIDTGVSGSAAQKIARKLGGIAGKRQVICITHQPQLAAMADHHFLIQKEVKAERTVTKVRELATEERAPELARITDGDVTETSLNHAREMLAKAEEVKCARSV